MGSDSFILVLLNKHTGVMDIELGDHSIQNDDDDYYDNYLTVYDDYLQVLRELCELLNDFLLNEEMIDYQQQSIRLISFDFIYWRLLLYLRLQIELILQLTKVFRRGIIFDSTTIPVHVLLLPYPNNNNTVMYVHVRTDNGINNDVQVPSLRKGNTIFGVLRKIEISNTAFHPYLHISFES